MIFHQVRNETIKYQIVEKVYMHPMNCSWIWNWTIIETFLMQENVNYCNVCHNFKWNWNWLQFTLIEIFLGNVNSHFYHGVDKVISKMFHFKTRTWKSWCKMTAECEFCMLRFSPQIFLIYQIFRSIWELYQLWTYYTVLVPYCYSTNSFNNIRVHIRDITFHIFRQARFINLNF